MPTGLVTRFFKQALAAGFSIHTAFLPGMTLPEFNALPYARQLATVFDTGSFLALRGEAGDAVSLYHLPGGLLVEVFYDTRANEIVRVYGFAGAASLEAYAAYITLPDSL